MELPPGSSPYHQTPLTESIHLADCPVPTLRELVGSGSHTVFVGLNPSPGSVAAGHYYQGRLGRQFWRCMERSGIGGLCPSDQGREDLVLFRQGFGFLDLVRRPTRSASEIRTREWKEGIASLPQRLSGATRSPCVVFVYKSAADMAAPSLRTLGYRTFTIGCVARQFRLPRFEDLAYWLFLNALPVL